MRSVFGSIFFVWMFVLTLLAPFVGVLSMVVLNYLSPERSAYGLLGNLNFSMIFGVATLVSAVLVDRKKQNPVHPISILIGIFLIWICVTTQFSWVDSEVVGEKWSRTFKVIGFSLFSITLISTRVRLEAFIWVIVLCISYYVFTGAAKTILSGGGGYTVIGNESGFLGPRSHFATAIVMIVPLVWFLARHTLIFEKFRFPTPAMAGVIALSLIALVGTQSRTGFLAAAAAGLVALLRAKFKFKALALASVVGLLAFLLAPSDWINRMQTIEQYEQDGSAMARIQSWQFAIDVARRSPITGGGFKVFVLNVPVESDEYLSSIGDGEGQNRGTRRVDRWLEAHSIYFEVLGEHGYVGLMIFLAVIASCIVTCLKTIARLRETAGMEWAVDLSTALLISFVAYCVGGAFISIASHAILYDFAVIVVATNLICRRAQAKVEHSSVKRPGV